MSKFLELANNMRFITRYSNVERVRDEDVAQHSFLVCAIVMELYADYSFSLGSALKIAVAHDMMESVTGDISHALKRDSPDLARALEEVERSHLHIFPEVVRESMERFFDDSTESKIVQLADAMQVLQYTSSEVRLGNTGRIKNIYLKTIARVRELEKELVYDRKH